MKFINLYGKFVWLVDLEFRFKLVLVLVMVWYYLVVFVYFSLYISWGFFKFFVWFGFIG